MLHDICVAPFELKLAGDGTTGEFSGYGAVFGNQDSHGDVIAPGAFKDSIAERQTAGRKVAMHVMHGIYGGDGVPVGVWNNVEEDSKGLRVDGKISGMNTDAGRLLHERVKDGALGGLSIGYTVKKNGATYGTKPGEPKRLLKALNLHEISLVDDPSNALARVTEMKRLARIEAKVSFVDSPDLDKLEESIAAAILLQDAAMQTYYSGSSAKDAALLMDRLRDAYEALTGQRAPDELAGWTKNAPTIREIEKLLREEGGMSHSQARAVVERRFKAQPRDEGGRQTNIAEGASELLAALKDFQLS